MCACGCLLALGLAGAIAYFILHALWWPAGAVLAVGILVGWLGAKAMQKPKPPQ
ncbi:MAG TPA: hypothetical protein VGL72_23330 [Bryobacteraceae bacterium]|jgi:uncharacterized membrane protein YfcA